MSNSKLTPQEAEAMVTQAVELAHVKLHYYPDCKEVLINFNKEDWSVIAPDAPGQPLKQLYTHPIDGHDVWIQVQPGKDIVKGAYRILHIVDAFNDN